MTWSTNMRGVIVAVGSLLGGLGCDASGSIPEEILSERGGFANPAQRLASDSEGDYCAAEILRWQHDASTETLVLADARVLLGCCGRRGARVERVDSLIELTEVDAPETSGRCEGTCAYDVAIKVPAVPAGPVVLRVLRDVTDAQGGPELVWQGTLHLGQGSGAITVQDEPADAACRERSTQSLDGTWITQASTLTP
ncbi:hypothetical protein [Chondromyces apiculatus]|uniref:Uncharacterized protein n=1 Tax=Chondromyces apiculatus DSM 436 TaxID=1192034 RepID=A0A017T678_9BACT|nr:hypothetical protein [Chondromyces apiculatus]EYF04517.1 Hypothetical protein CAP_4485 [Chondromyces apiculatus DSM 436]